jgi:hypothetical protein
MEPRYQVVDGAALPFAQDGDDVWTYVLDTHRNYAQVFAVSGHFSEMAQEFADRLNVRELAGRS